MGLSDEGSKQRRNLLFVAAICLALVKLGIVPTKIQALGVELSAGERDNLLKGALAVLVYFFFAFLSHALADAAEAVYDDREVRRRYDQEVRRAHEEAEHREISLYTHSSVDPEQLDKELRELSESVAAVEFRRAARTLLFRASLPRVFLDFLFPILLAGYAAVTVVLEIRS
jgi:hypothetical protein